MFRGNCLKYLKKGWNRRGEEKLRFLKWRQAGTRGRCLKNKGAETPLQTKVQKKIFSHWFFDDVRNIVTHENRETFKIHHVNDLERILNIDNKGSRT